MFSLYEVYTQSKRVIYSIDWSMSQCMLELGLHHVYMNIMFENYICMIIFIMRLTINS